MPQNHPKIKNILQLNILMDHAGGSDGKESACNAGEPGLIPGFGRSPGGEKRQPSPVFLLLEFHAQRSLTRYNP